MRRVRRGKGDEPGQRTHLDPCGGSGCDCSSGCVVSLALRRPLLLVASVRLAQARPDLVARRANLDTPGARQALTTLTAMIGVTTLLDAAAQVVLALTVSTATFGVAARIASYVIIGGGLAVSALYVRVVRAQRPQSQ
ncbi:MAG: hypothetical protein ACRDPM_19845 [Solirubrobacteraceae bacterium]